MPAAATCWAASRATSEVAAAVSPFFLAARAYTGGEDGAVRAFLLDLDDLVAAARERVTRPFSDDKYRRDLNLEQCPPKLDVQ